jgi:hypothetical protein
VAVLAVSVTIGPTTYSYGTDSATMPVAAVDAIRNPSAWVGGVAPPLSGGGTRTTINPSELTTPLLLRNALGLKSGAFRESTDYAPATRYMGSFADGSDGTAVLDGTTVLNSPFSGPTNGVYTLIRDAYLANLTVAAAATLNTNGYVLNVADTLTNAGKISFDGYGTTSSAAPGTQYGANLNSGSYGKAGAAGAGTAGTNVTGSLGGAGGAGGNGTSGSGGVAGTATQPETYQGRGRWRQAPYALQGYASTANGTFQWFGGASGGAGAGDGTNSGGGSGHGGGISICNAAHVVQTGSGSWSAKGGNGGPGAGGNTGGGGGGGGGAVIINCLTFMGTPPVSATATAGGTGGAGTGSGTAGQAGSVGRAIVNVWT